MKTYSKLIAAFALVVLAAAMPTGAADPKPATNDFIIRAPAAAIDGIASRNGLTVVSQIAAATDEDGHGLFLLRDDSGTAAPEVVMQNVRSLEPDADGIEEVFLASLPKLNQSTAVVLDTSAVDSALGAVNGFEPPSAVISATWNSHDHDREIRDSMTETVEFEFEAPTDTDPANYSFGVNFTGGSTYSCDPPACGPNSFNGNKLGYDVANNTGADLHVESVNLTWPSANGKLLTAELHNDSLLDAPYEKFGKNPDGTDRNLWTGYLNQAATGLLQLDEAQKTFLGEATVAIIDTGIDPDHPVLAANLVPGYDFVNDVAGSASEMGDLDQSTAVVLDQSTAVVLDQSTAVVLDTNNIPPTFGHGTMVAGVVHRVAPEASIMPLKAFDANGNAHLYDIVDAIYYAVDNGANVINLSFSLEAYSPELMRAINYAARNGVACVASAGNLGEETLIFPAAFGNTIGVASTDDADQLSVFSNWGSDLVTVAAPGENIVTTYPGSRWAVASGTSFSAPWIAGGAALFADKLGTRHAPGVADYYLSSNALAETDPVVGSGADKAGYGRANLHKAVDSVKSGHYAENRPLGTYTFSATFAEGCTANYPPPSSGGGCTVNGAGQLKFENKKIIWVLTNDSEADVTLDSLSISWEADNGDLQTVRVDGTLVDSVVHTGTSATITTGWQGTAQDRTWAPHQSLEVELDFQNSVVWTY